MINMQVFLVDDNKENIQDFINEAINNWHIPIYLRKGDFVRQIAQANPMIPKDRVNNIIMIITADYNGKYEFQC